MLQSAKFGSISHLFLVLFGIHGDISLMHNDLEFLGGLDGDGPSHNGHLCWRTGVAAAALSDWAGY